MLDCRDSATVRAFHARAKLGRADDGGLQTEPLPRGTEPYPALSRCRVHHRGALRPRVQSRARQADHAGNGVHPARGPTSDPFIPGSVDPSFTQPLPPRCPRALLAGRLPTRLLTRRAPPEARSPALARGRPACGWPCAARPERRPEGRGGRRQWWRRGHTPPHRAGPRSSHLIAQLVRHGVRDGLQLLRVLLRPAAGLAAHPLGGGGEGKRGRVGV